MISLKHLPPTSLAPSASYLSCSLRKKHVYCGPALCHTKCNALWASIVVRPNHNTANSEEVWEPKQTSFHPYLSANKAGWLWVTKHHPPCFPPLLGKHASRAWAKLQPFIGEASLLKCVSPSSIQTEELCYFAWWWDWATEPRVLWFSGCLLEHTAMVNFWEL